MIPEPIDASRITENLYVGSFPPGEAGKYFDVIVLCATELQPLAKHFAPARVLYCPLADCALTVDAAQRAENTDGRGRAAHRTRTACARHLSDGREPIGARRRDRALSRRDVGERCDRTRALQARHGAAWYTVVSTHESPLRRIPFDACELSLLIAASRASQTSYASQLTVRRRRTKRS